MHDGKRLVGQHGQVRLEILSDASELPLDLTGLALIESSEAKANLSRVLAEAANTLDRAMPECVRMAPNAASGLKSLLGQLQTAR